MGNPDRSGGFYFVVYDSPVCYPVDRQKGAFRHYIQYMKAGECTYYTDQGNFQLKTGDFFYLPKGLRYTASFRNIQMHSCGFTLFPEAEYKPFSFQLLPEQFALRFLQIPKNIVPDTKTLAMFYKLLEDLLPCMQRSADTTPSDLENKIRVYLWKNFASQVSDIAKYCNLSVPHLYRLLKQQTNKTPNQIKQDVLMEKAMLELTQTNTSIGQISEMLGFSNPNYFGQLFKRYTGKTPMQFRQESSTGEVRDHEGEPLILEA